jgi:hypothetical protein
MGPGKMGQWFIGKLPLDYLSILFGSGEMIAWQLVGVNLTKCKGKPFFGGVSEVL